MAADVRELRARELYRRLPEVYRVRDWQAAVERMGEAPVQAGQALPELEAFLGVIAADVRRLRDHIGGLWDDFFIETCAEWVVPYLGDLLGVRLIFNAAQRNRVDVTKTVEWRRRKGTLRMLGELAGDITGWAAEAAECFENLGWAQGLNHLKLDHLASPDLRDPERLSRLGTASDPWLHAADVRRPQGSVGRYGIRTIGFFLSRLNAYPLHGVTSVDLGATERFSFDPLGRDVPLFDGVRRAPIPSPAFAQDPLRYFGDPCGLAVRQHGILVATERPPTPDLTEPTALWSGFGPDGGTKTHLGDAGLELMEPELFEHPARRFVITALWGDFTTATELGSLQTLGQVLTPAPGGEAAGAGSLLLTVRLEANADTALFPATVLAVRNDVAIPRIADALTNRYRDALYVYLPEMLLAPGEVLRLYVGDEGSTIYACSDPAHLGAANVGPPDVFAATTQGPRLKRTLLARAGQGQCFPTRRVQHSLLPASVTDLHRTIGLRLADERLFVNVPGEHGARRFVIEARLFYGDPPLTPLLGSLATATTPFQYQSDPNVLIPDGAKLLLRVSPVTGADTLFPMTDLIVTDRAGRALLVALPEMEFATFTAPVWLAFDTAGATYYASTDFGHDTTLARPERDGAFHYDPQDPRSGLARRSAGQVWSMPDRVPLQQRVPVYANLCHWDHPKPRPPRAGQLAIDPARGRFLFAPNDGPRAPSDGGPLGLGGDYCEAFTYDVGALTYDRYPSLKAPDHPQPTRYVARSGDADRGSAPVHTSVADAVAVAQDGDVIQIEDSATYEHAGPLKLMGGGVRRLVIQSANRQRPCLHFSAGSIEVGAADSLRLNGLLVSGAGLEITDASAVQRLDLVACSFDPVSTPVTLTANDRPEPTPVSRISLCRCVSGALRFGQGVSEVVVADSIIDAAGGIAIGDLTAHPAQALVHLERTTVWGRGLVHRLFGSECLLSDVFLVSDQQHGCLRYSRFQLGSALPRRFQCVPPADQPGVDAVTPAFNTRRFGRPAYGQLHLVCPSAVLRGGEDGAEMGAFHGGLTSLREKNLGVKLEEYLPAGLTPALIYVT